MSKLAEQSLRVCLENASDETLKNVFAQLSLTELKRISFLSKQSILAQAPFIINLSPTRADRCVLRKNCLVSDRKEFPPHIHDFLLRYGYSKTIEHEQRTDPVLVLTCLLLPDPTIKIEKLKPNSAWYISWTCNNEEDDSDDDNYRRYNDAWYEDLSTGYETVYKTSGLWSEPLTIRPPDFFAQISQYAEEKGLELKIPPQEKIIRQGPYRLFD